MRDIGKNIRSLRQKRNISQDQLAQMLHVTRQTISNYETGRSRPDVEMLAELAQALDADIKELLYGPTGMEHSARLLRHLAMGAVLTGLAAIFYFVGGHWAQRLLQERYLICPVYMVVFFVKPLFFILLGWTLSQACLVLLRSEPLHSPEPEAPFGRDRRMAGRHVSLVFLSGPGPVGVSSISLGTRSSLSAVQFPFRCVFALCGPPPQGPLFGQCPVRRSPGDSGLPSLPEPYAAQQ